MVFIPLFIAYIFYLLVTPLIEFLGRRFSFPKKIYATIILMFLGVFFFLFFKYFWESINILINEFDTYITQFRTFAENYLARLKQRIPMINTENMMSGPIASIIQYSTTGIKDFIQILTLSFICSLFFIFDPLSLRKMGKNFTLIKLEKKLRHYALIKSVTSLVTGLIIYFYLLFLGYEFAFFLGFGTFLLNFIPSFGSIIATLLLIPVFGIEERTGSDILALLIFPGLVQFIIGNIIEPKFMGEALHLSPVIIILSLIFWSIIFGVYGLFLGVPFSLVIDAAIRSSNLKKKLWN